jgi:membrane protease YdiL (CAAX protease family)
VSGFLFGILHLANPEVQLLGKVVLIYYILTGVFVGILTAMDNGLELGIGFHAANNIFGCLILTNNWQVFQTDAIWKDMTGPSIGWDIWVTLFIVYPLLLVLYSKIYKWKSFKSVLFEVYK